MENQNIPVNAKEMRLDSSYKACVANDVMKGRIELTNREAQILYAAISQVVKEDKDLRTYKVRAVDLAEFLGIDPDCLYDDLFDVCVKLRKRTFGVKISPTQWKVFGWVDTAEYDNGVLTIKLSDGLKPYIIDLNNHYISYSLGAIKNFKSMYARRVFEYLLCDYRANEEGKYEWKLTLEQLRDIFALDETYKSGKKEGKYKKYPLTHDLLANTIDKAYKELNGYNFIHITQYRHTKQGKAIEGVSFCAEFYYDLDVKKEEEKEQRRLKRMSEWKAKKLAESGDDQLRFEDIAQ